MNCPFCNSETEVYNSRKSHRNTQTWRRRRCKVCRKAFTTREKIDFSGLILVKTDNSTSPYNRERLFLSVLRAADKLTLPSDMISELADAVESELKKIGFFTGSLQKAGQIVETTSLVLKRYNPNLALQYINNVYANQPPVALISQLVSM